MKHHIIRIALVAAVVMTNIGCDQVTKHYAKKYLPMAGTVSVLGDYVILRYTENRGAFLSIFADLAAPARMVLLMLLPTIALLVMAGYVMRVNALSVPSIVAMSSVIGGGASNLIDRYANNQQVIDFLNFGIGSLRTGILNAADLSITFGAIALILLMHTENKRNAAKDAATGTHT